MVGLGKPARISGLRLGARYTVTVSAPGFETTRTLVTCEGDATAPVIVNLAPAG